MMRVFVPFDRSTSRRLDRPIDRLSSSSRTPADARHDGHLSAPKDGTHPCTRGYHDVTGAVTRSMLASVFGGGS